MKHITLILLAALAVGCAKKESSTVGSQTVQIPNDGTPYIPPTVGPGYDPGYIYGATAPFEITSLATMSEYTDRAMYNPQQVEVNLNFNKYGDTYGGTVRITYSDYGQRREGYFTSGHSASETRYNEWFRRNGKDIWQGFFEDYYGAIIVVIDGVTDLGDGGGGKMASGSIWFKNFAIAKSPDPNKLFPSYRGSWCWFVSLGPYDCRAWKTEREILPVNQRSIYPDSGYKKLGTFSEIDLKKAFNGAIQ